jgi:zinc transport system substrate-binding protein
MRWTSFAVVAGILGLAAGAAVTGQEAPKTRAFVSILPQSYFVQRVGGEYVDVSVMVGPGQEPHTFEVTPRQMADLSDARVYFTIGMPFETVLVQKIKGSIPNLKIVDTRQGVKMRFITKDEAGGGAAPGPGEAAGEPDPHIWLDPKLVKIQARTICDALEGIDPAHKTAFETNLASFIADLDAVDKRIAAALAPLVGREFFVYHPAFGYFAERYGLRQVPVELGGREPSAKELAGLIDKAKADEVQVIFVEPQFSTKGARAVAEAIGGVVIPMDDLSADYIKNLENMAAKVEGALAAGAGKPARQAARRAPSRVGRQKE